MIKRLIDSGFIVVYKLAEPEKELAKSVSEEIARHPLAKDNDPQSHYPEGEAMALMSREGFRNSEILLDELAAREVTKARGFSIVGFGGLLIRACQQKWVSPEDVRTIMFKCQSLGTNYANAFIEGIYERLKEEPN